ncbi:MAG: hypothetical protein AB7U73_02560 [Pirellulales bacterium]
MPTNYFRPIALALATIGLLASGQLAAAGNISFTNQSIEIKGTGLGNVLDILFVHANDSEYGSVLWNGASDVETDDAIKQSQTRTIGELTKVGINNSSQIGLILNIAEAGNQPTINVLDFSMRFTDSKGVALFPDIDYSAPVGGLVLAQVGAGVGGSGWVFKVNLTPAEEALAFGNADNRIGMYITEANAFTLTSGAPDGFFIAPIPEPMSWVLAAIGGVGLLVWRRAHPPRRR